ncbi:hypothetical protein BDY24DRAFT_133093 [Mrakia frigida]|uniref:uncharacterized protein n=1 Tax=Mrakia frigida TaxID=29902 RepID=UPI003FCBFEBE
MRLLLNGKSLHNESTLSDLGIAKGTIFHLSLTPGTYPPSSPSEPTPSPTFASSTPPPSSSSSSKPTRPKASITSSIYLPPSTPPKPYRTPVIPANQLLYVNEVTFSSTSNRGTVVFEALVPDVPEHGKALFLIARDTGAAFVDQHQTLHGFDPEAVQRRREDLQALALLQLWEGVWIHGGPFRLGRVCTQSDPVRLEHSPLQQEGRLQRRSSFEKTAVETDDGGSPSGSASKIELLRWRETGVWEATRFGSGFCDFEE